MRKVARKETAMTQKLSGAMWAARINCHKMLTRLRSVNEECLWADGISTPLSELRACELSVTDYLVHVDQVDDGVLDHGPQHRHGDVVEARRQGRERQDDKGLSPMGSRHSQ